MRKALEAEIALEAETTRYLRAREQVNGDRVGRERVDEDRVLGDVRGIDEEGCDILGGEGAHRGWNAHEWTSSESTGI